MEHAIQLVQQNLSYILFVLLVAMSFFCLGLLRSRPPRIEAQGVAPWQLANHPLTDKGLEIFLADWKKSGQRIL